MITVGNNLEKFFKIISYGVILSSFFTIVASGSIGVIGGFFFLLMTFVAWYLEGAKWQLSEKWGVIIIVLIVPLFYLDWRFNLSGFSSRDAFTAGNLSRLILILAIIKLLQKKSDRDWVFIYIISFFQILLAAGTGVSPLFILGLLIYLLLAFISIILFEIRKSSKLLLEKNEKAKPQSLDNFSSKHLVRLPITSFVILVLISIFAVPLFFSFPRVGGANFGGSLGDLTGLTGFSDSVRLGEIGKLQQTDEIVMRVRLEKSDEVGIKSFRWRGVALDSFDNQTWRKSNAQYLEPYTKNERDFFQFDSVRDTKRLVTQTVYLEAIDTPVLFTLSRPIALQGNFKLVSRDAEGSLSTLRPNWGRTSYKVISDTDLPNEQILRQDNLIHPKSFQRYLQLPEKIDYRITELASQIIENSSATNRYDQAKAIENYLQNNLGYTLDLKASGDEPLSDFLFNVKEGHCEYFASALAIMLRTQGIASRVVNGFQSGEYNETAEVYVVRQKDAHSWVEVYFPKENVWVPFDATPSAGQFSYSTSPSLMTRISKTIEALETFWIQYVVSYDNQEQRSLFLSIRKSLSELKDQFSVWIETTQESLFEWWKDVRGEKGFTESIKAIGFGLGYLLLVISGVLLTIWLLRKLINLAVWQNIRLYFSRKKETSIVEFYQRMQKVLEKQGLVRQSYQTPLEFAFALNMPKAVLITEKYNQVRFGEKELSKREAEEIENWLVELENNGKQK